MGGFDLLLICFLNYFPLSGMLELTLLVYVCSLMGQIRSHGKTSYQLYYKISEKYLKEAIVTGKIYPECQDILNLKCGWTMEWDTQVSPPHSLKHLFVIESQRYEERVRREDKYFKVKIIITVCICWGPIIFKEVCCVYYLLLLRGHGFHLLEWYRQRKWGS